MVGPIGVAHSLLQQKEIFNNFTEVKPVVAAYSASLIKRGVYKSTSLRRTETKSETKSFREMTSSFIF